MSNLADRIATAREHYARDGVAVVPGVFGRHEVDRIRACAYACLGRPNPAYRHNPVDWRGDFAALLYWPALVDEYLDQIRRDERMVAIVRAFLGDDVKQLNNQIYYRLPGDGDEFGWHRDLRFRVPRWDYPGVEDAYLQTIIAVDEITAENSPVEFLPGSHNEELPYGVRDEDDLRRFDRKHLAGIKYTAKPGDVLVWSVMVVHGSERNDSQWPRMSYMNGFARADAAREWPHYLKAGEPVPVDAGAIP